MNEEFVLCGASAYTRKFYINPEFESLPQTIKDELNILCVLHTEDVGGIIKLSFDEDGDLQITTDYQPEDYTFDEIGAALKVKQYQRERKELFESLETYFKVVFLGEDVPEQ